MQTPWKVTHGTGQVKIQLPVPATGILGLDLLFQPFKKLTKFFYTPILGFLRGIPVVSTQKLPCTLLCQAALSLTFTTQATFEAWIIRNKRYFCKSGKSLKPRTYLLLILWAWGRCEESSSYYLLNEYSEIREIIAIFFQHIIPDQPLDCSCFYWTTPEKSKEDIDMIFFLKHKTWDLKNVNT